MHSEPWPYNTIREPGPADWGIGMTVCIASFCFQDDCIIAIEDSMLSTSDMSADNLAIKHKSLGGKWVALLAGNDVSASVPMVADVQRTMAKSSDETLEEVVSAFQVAFRKQIVRKAETTILSRFDIGMSEFRETGLASFGSELFTRLIYEIEQVSLDLIFLVFGFEGETQHIFTVQGSGAAQYYDAAGFWAIGSGQTSALATLFATTIPMPYLSLPIALYMTSKAKFNAETALGVGKDTTGLILESSGERCVIHSDEMRNLKALWEQQKQPDFPDETNNFCTELIKRSKVESVRIDALPKHRPGAFEGT
jgi:ATP-dependent protease HslVU (ClpYQ) peptidase subunit